MNCVTRLDESLARGHARALICELETRVRSCHLRRAADAPIPFNEKGQRRWLRRFVSAARPVSIGRPVATFGWSFFCAIPAFNIEEGNPFDDGWQGLSIGQVTASASGNEQMFRRDTFLAVDAHALTRIGQRAAIVGAGPVLDLLKPALPWLLAHLMAGLKAGAERFWVPVNHGVLVCRSEESRITKGRQVVFAATFIAETRMTPGKARLLERIRAAHGEDNPRFPLNIDSDAQLEEVEEFADRLADIYASVAAHDLRDDDP